MVANHQNPISEALSATLNYRDLPSSTRITNLSSSASALLAAQYSLVNKKNCLILCPNQAIAQIFFEDFKTFSALNSMGTHESFLYTGWEISPYSKLSPSIGHRVQRLRCLDRLARNAESSKFIISTLQAIAQPTISPRSLAARTIILRIKELRPMEGLVRALRSLGYIETTIVEDPGTYSIRGGIMDIFSPLEKLPIRIDFWDDEIEKLRFFQTTSQRTLPDIQIESYIIGPLRELEAFSEDLERARINIRNWCDEHNYSRAEREHILSQLADNIVTEQMDYLLPFFNQEKSHLWEHFKNDFTSIWMDQKSCEEEYQIFTEKLHDAYHASITQKQICSEPNEIALPLLTIKNSLPNQLYFDPFTILTNTKQNIIKIEEKENPCFTSFKKAKKGAAPQLELDVFCNFIREHLDLGYYIICGIPSQQQIDKLLFLLSQNKISTSTTTFNRGSLFIAPLSISKGFTLPLEKLIFLSEIEIFGARKISSNQNKASTKNLSKILQQTSLDNLQVGEFLVHIDHGIGKYCGLVKLSPGGIPGDYVLVEYASADKLYLPIYRLERIQKYIGGGDSVPKLDRLGSQQFEKVKERARNAIKEVALRLLNIYAKRASTVGYSFRSSSVEYAEFEERFPYNETPDQRRAIEETISDMCSSKPMDRLICGDVGYGKTEVAMRAAFLAANDGKQVAVLVPTTILAEQHLQNFRLRFENTPIRIESLSRFRNKNQQSEIIEKTKAGLVDVLIGTHRILSKDVTFKDLGLIIIDEEQRFGVEHKEKLKQLRIATDVLTLTATPIPRTLHLSMLGIRDISIIHTPPADRLAIRTHIAEFDTEIIRTAIENEVHRGGQVFFIHNRVQSIPTIFRTLQEILPNIRIGVAHGQMPEKELEDVMVGFYQKKYDVLLSTAIIENGLDIPSANTIIVNRADSFGLSQLYQIRGRVGRSQTRAYAYLLLPNDQPITEDAKKRLQVLERHIELGSGFAISSHDLELRGAGDILGDAQSGHATDIGYDLYMEMLAEEISSLRGEEHKQMEDIEISSSFPAYLPEDYIPDTRSRLSLYKRLSTLETAEEIEQSREELLDRYGSIPPVTDELFWLLKIKLLLRSVGFKSLKISAQKLSLEAGNSAKIDVPKLLQLVQRNPSIYSFSSDSKLLICKSLTSLKESYNLVLDFIRSLDPISD